MNNEYFLKKCMAFFVIFTFICLVYASTATLDNASTSNAGKKDRITDTEEDIPGAVEKSSSVIKKKKSPLIPIIVGLVGLGGVAAILILVVMKSYDIRGTWTLTYIWSGQSPGYGQDTFSGSKKSGIVSSEGHTGNYTVDGKNVEWTWFNGTKYTGTFTDKNTMSGTMATTGTLRGTFTSKRASSNASSPAPASIRAKNELNSMGEK